MSIGGLLFSFAGSRGGYDETKRKEKMKIRQWGEMSSLLFERISDGMVKTHEIQKVQQMCPCTKNEHIFHLCCFFFYSLSTTELKMKHKFSCSTVPDHSLKDIKVSPSLPTS